jgi:hypothetical protein
VGSARRGSGLVQPFPADAAVEALVSAASVNKGTLPGRVGILTQLIGPTSRNVSFCLAVH